MKSHSQIFLAGLIACCFAAGPATLPATQPAEARTLRVTDLPLKPAAAGSALAAKLKLFDLKPVAFEATLRRVSEEPDVEIFQVNYPTPLPSPWPENNTVPGELYLRRQVKGKITAVIVLDILDGSAFLPRGLARGFAANGAAGLYIPMACFSARRPKNNAHVAAFQADPTKAIDNMRQTVLDIRRAKAILSSLPQVDPNHICITGISMGGIMTALAAGVDGEFDRVVPILAGGDLATITFHARETGIIRRGLEAKGYTQEMTVGLMEPVDPLTFASRIDPARCLMINASIDEVIPRITTEALHKAMGLPQILWAPTGHYSAGLFLPNIRQKTIDFILGKQVDSLQL